MLSLKFQFFWYHINFLKVNRWRLKHHKRLQSWWEREIEDVRKLSSSISHPRKTISSTCGIIQQLFHSKLCFWTFVWMFFLPPEVRANFWGFIFCLLWLLEKKSQNCVEGKITSGSNPLPYIPIHRAASSLFFFKTRTWHETSAAICQMSLCCFFCFFPIYQPEGCTDQHFTQALHFHWTKQTLRTARVNFSGEMRRTTLIFFYAWSFLKMCLIYLNIKKKILP